MKTRKRLSLEGFLALPETKPYREYIDGEAVEKAMPSRMHSTIVRELVADLTMHVRENPIASVDTELRHLDADGGWVFLPDVSVTLRSRRPVAPSESENPVRVLPDFAIEVLSPEHRPGPIARKIANYMRTGVTLLWVVDPEDEQVTIWERGAEPRVAGHGDVLTGAPILPGFSMDLGRLFATLHEA